MCNLLASGLILCAGALGYAGPLDAVAERRYVAAWGGLTSDPAGYEVLVGVSDCGLLGQNGILIAGGRIYRALVSDCKQQAHPWPRGYLADVNVRGLKEGWLMVGKKE